MVEAQWTEMMGTQYLGVSQVSSPHLGVLRFWASVFGLLSLEKGDTKTSQGSRKQSRRWSWELLVSDRVSLGSMVVGLGEYTGAQEFIFLPVGVDRHGQGHGKKCSRTLKGLIHCTDKPWPSPRALEVYFKDMISFVIEISLWLPCSDAKSNNTEWGSCW